MTAAPKRKAAMSAQELRDLMDANGVKYASDLAERIGVNRSTVTRWLHGGHTINRATALLIRSILKIM